MDYEVKKSKKPLLIAFIVLGVIILALVGYIVIDRMFFHKEDESSTIILDDVSLDISVLYNIEDTLNNFDRAFNYEDSSFYGYIYKSKKLSSKDFDSQAAIYAAMRTSMTNTQEARYIPEVNIKAEFNKMYGKNVTYTPSNIAAGDNYVINYEAEAKRYAYIATEAAKAFKSGIMTINTKTKIAEETVIVTRKVFYVEYVADEAGNVTTAIIYNDMNKKQNLGKVSVVKKAVDPEEVIGKYGSKLSTYDFVFKENSKDTNYSFYSVEKVK